MMDDVAAPVDHCKLLAEVTERVSALPLQMAEPPVLFMMGVKAGSTVTVTVLEDAVAPFASNACAVNVWVPADSPVNTSEGVGEVVITEVFSSIV
jgi:hypothetical protein